MEFIDAILINLKKGTYFIYSYSHEIITQVNKTKLIEKDSEQVIIVNLNFKQ